MVSVLPLGASGAAAARSSQAEQIHHRSSYDHLTNYEMARQYKSAPAEAPRQHQWQHVHSSHAPAATTSTTTSASIASTASLFGLAVVPTTTAQKASAAAEALHTTLAPPRGAQLIGQPHNDEHLVEQYIRQEIVDFQWGPAGPGEKKRPGPP